jgi:hypothetical protein
MTVSGARSSGDFRLDFLARWRDKDMQYTAGAAIGGAHDGILMMI